MFPEFSCVEVVTGGSRKLVSAVAGAYLKNKRFIKLNKLFGYRFLVQFYAL